MTSVCNHFDPIPYARFRTYNEDTGRQMKAVPVVRDSQGVWQCAALAEAKWQIGLEWDQPRDFLGAELTFAQNSPLPEDWHVEYWQYSWPNEQKDRRAGAHKGWLLTDDAFHGQWLAAYGEKTCGSNGCAISFDHMDVNEVICLGGDYPQNLFLSDDYNAMFRRALKVRFVFEGAEAPKIQNIQLIGDAVMRQDSCMIYPNATGKGGEIGVSGISVWNGSLVQGKADGTQPVKITYQRTVGARTVADQTIVQVQLGDTGFGARAEDIENGMYFQDFDLLIAPDGMGNDPVAIIKKLMGNKESIFDRVMAHPEQSVENAMREVPPMEKNMQPKYGRYVLMGWEGVRQKFALRYNGDIFANKIDQKVSARDTAKTRWAGNELHFRLASGDPPSRREGNDDATQYMPDASMPVYVTEWMDREIAYRQTCFATLLEQTPQDIRGDEDIMVMARMELRNASSDARMAHLFIELYPGEQLHLNGQQLMASGRVRPGDTSVVGWTVQPYPDSYLRAHVDTVGRGSLRCVPLTFGGTTSLSMQPQFGFEGYDRNTVRQPPSSCVPSALLYEVELQGFETHTIEINIPYPSYSKQKDIETAISRSFSAELMRVNAFWHGLANQGASIDLPGETKLNDFAKAVPWHVIMTAMQDVRTRLFMVPAGTYGYGSCGNEASLQIRMLDYLGFHDRAEKYLQTFIVSQSVGKMDGNFRTNDGALVANNYGGYSDKSTSSFAYNLDHGYILACLVDHYKLTGNQNWLIQVAPTLVKACDYIFNERKATMLLDDDGEKVSYYGLMPHGHLEDNPEWRCWFAVNAHACGGILGAAKVLEDIHHPEAQRMMDEAIAYRSDIREAATRAMAKSPAVPMGNGGYMPHIPTQAEIRGRDWGWFREAAYGPLHLANGLVLNPNEPMTTWILRDQEDNLFLSRDYGRTVDRDRDWFSRGGMTIQSNLLFNDLVYLQRGENERAIRTLFNNFAQNLYRDMNCFSEHPITDFGKGFGPFFKTPDEAQFIVNLRNHLLREEEDTLYVLQGASQQWFEAGKELRLKELATNFGKVSLHMAVAKDNSHIRLEINAQWRQAPEKIRISLRRPDGQIPQKTVLNGETLVDAATFGQQICIAKPGQQLILLISYQV